jgi:hypothetical protein
MEVCLLAYRCVCPCRGMGVWRRVGVYGHVEAWKYGVAHARRRGVVKAYRHVDVYAQVEAGRQ